MFKRDMIATPDNPCRYLLGTSTTLRMPGGRIYLTKRKAMENYDVFKIGLPSGKLTWQWKMALLKMYSLFENGIFHCHVSLPEGII